MSSRVPSLLAATATIIALFPRVATQVISTATCLPEYNWMDNSKSQSPCLVGAYLQSACTNGNFEVTPLPEGTHYAGPNKQQINPCQCSTVTFSMMSACGICQGRTAWPWSSWSFNCTTIHPREFPETIPANTAVPAWAYLDVQTSDYFDPTAAQADDSAPESTGGPLATSTTTPSNGHSGSNSHTGAIVGGVVGGVVILGIISGAMVFLIIRRRRRRHIAPSAAYDPLCKNGSINSSIPSPSMDQAYMHSIDNRDSRYPSEPRPHLKLYDPSDPSTFPSTPSPPSTIYTTRNDHVVHGRPQTRPGQYNFVPEV